MKHERSSVILFFQQRGKYVLNNEKPIPNLNSKQVTKVIASANAQQQ